MSRIDPLPFRFRVPGQETLDSTGISSVSYRGQGLLHLEGGFLAFEWRTTRKTQRIDGSGVATDVEHSPIGTLEVPVEWITGARLRGGWWRPRLELRAQKLDAFDGFPGKRPDVVRLKIRRRDREHARRFVAEIEQERGVGALPSERDDSRLGPPRRGP